MSVEKLSFNTVMQENIPFTMVCTKVIQSIAYNHFALTLWIYLSSLPPDWNVNKVHLKRELRIGDDKLNDALSFLNKSKLISYVKHRTPNGQISNISILVLNGSKFVNIQEDKTTRVEIHPSGDSGLQIETNNKENKKLKSSCSSEAEHVRFDEFWKLYPRKQNRHMALKIWRARKLDDIADEIIESVKKRLAGEWKAQEKRFIPLPSSYLNANRWEDEIEAVANVPEVDENLPKKEDVLPLLINRRFIHPLLFMLYEQIGSFELRNGKDYDLRRKLDQIYSHTVKEYINNPELAKRRLAYYQETGKLPQKDFA
ncbi:MAG: hypothetical protein WC753_04710 [Candidatus Gracilibacteria bacterium]|jgi:hypothetical protein